MCVKKKSHIPVSRMTRWIRVIATNSKQLGLRPFVQPLHQILCPNRLEHASSRDKNNDWGWGLGRRLVSLPACHQYIIASEEAASEILIP